MKLAKFKALDCDGLEIILEAGTPSQLNRVGYVRTTDVVEVQFPPLSGDNIAEELAAIELARSKIEGRYDSELARLDARKAELQARLPEEVAA